MTFQQRTAVLAILGLLTACGSGTAPDRVAPEPAAASGDDARSAPSAVEADGSGRHGESAAPAVALIQATDAAELRITLEQLLGQHATLAVRLMRARVDGDDALARVAVDALVTNTEQIGDLVESVYGPEGAAAFEELWSGHVTSMFDYAVGVAEEDAEAMRDAEAELEDYVGEFSAFLETATGGTLAAADLAPGLDMHVEDLLRQIDAYAAGDYARAFALQRDVYAHMFPTGHALAGGIAAQHPGEFPIPVDDPPDQLRSALGLLLGEHVELAIDAMRFGVRGAPPFEHAAAALNANTEALTEAMAALFGSEAAARFNTLWADHVDAFVGYTAGLAAGDEDAQDAALDRLGGFHHELGQQLSDMTGGELPVADAAEVLRVHDEQLVDQIDAYAAEDYETAYGISFDAYQHVFDTAAALAGAIEAHLGGQLPAGGAATGGGGTARHHDGESIR